MTSRHIAFERLYNFRDLGGYTADAGRTVRWGKLYRSDSLGKLAGSDWDRFRSLGVRTVIDLRYDFEIEARGRVPEADGLAYHHLSIEHRPYYQAGLGPEVDPVRYLADRYAEVASDGVVEIRRALEVIGAPGSGPLVFHCASGKDRTGLLAALVLGLLGVAEEDIVADFALTGLATAQMIAEFRDRHDSRPIRWPGFGQAPPAIMRAFLRELVAEHGSICGYARNRLGIGDRDIESLRSELLEG